MCFFESFASLSSSSSSSFFPHEYWGITAHRGRGRRPRRQGQREKARIVKGEERKKGREWGRRGGRYRHARRLCERRAADYWLENNGLWEDGSGRLWANGWGKGYTPELGPRCHLYLLALFFPPLHLWDECSGCCSSPGLSSEGADSLALIRSWSSSASSTTRPQQVISSFLLLHHHPASLFPPCASSSSILCLVTMVSCISPSSLPHSAPSLSVMSWWHRPAWFLRNNQTGIYFKSSYN